MSKQTSETFPEKESKAQCEDFKYIQDPRTNNQIQQQSAIADQIHRNNLKVFAIEITPKIKVKYAPSPLIKVQFNNGWYAMITDSGENAQITVLTVHGAPGDHREWAGLETEMKGYCRWVNLIVPGFDGLDERRGNYTGSAYDLAKLITMVLNKLKIAEVVLCGHSMGGILAGFFFDAFPQYFRGFINITGIVNSWYVGLKTFYRVTVGAYGFGHGPNRNALMRLLNKDEYRQKHHARYIADTRQVFFGKVQFPALTVTEMAAYIKIISSLSKGSSHFYKLNHKIKMLRVLIFGRNDPLHTPELINEQIYSICRGRFKYSNDPRNSKILSTAKQELERTLFAQFGIKVEAQKLQQYFCYHFDETGHNAHKRRPKEISRILRIYFVCIRILEKYENLTRTSM